VDSFTPQLLYPQGTSHWYPSDRRLGGSQSHSGCSGESLYQYYIGHCPLFKAFDSSTPAFWQLFAIILIVFLSLFIVILEMVVGIRPGIF
jgi:hypothetical protein